MDSTHHIYLLICHVNVNYFGQQSFFLSNIIPFDKQTCLTSVLNLCRYGKATHGIFEKLGIPGSKPLMYLGTVGKPNYVCILITVVLITLSVIEA